MRANRGARKTNQHTHTRILSNTHTHTHSRILSKCPPGIWLLKLAHPNVNCMQNSLSLPPSLSPSLCRPKPMRSRRQIRRSIRSHKMCALSFNIFKATTQTQTHSNTRGRTHTRTNTHTQLQHEANKCREHEGFIKIKYLPRRISWVREQGKEREPGRGRGSGKGSDSDSEDSSSSSSSASQNSRKSFTLKLFTCALPAVAASACAALSRALSLCLCVVGGLARALHSFVCLPTLQAVHTHTHTAALKQTENFVFAFDFLC